MNNKIAYGRESERTKAVRWSALLAAGALISIIAWIVGIIGLMATMNEGWLYVTTAAAILWLVTMLPLKTMSKLSS